ncbi:hypothetical protein ACFQE5_01580 [Pseudonocardia hispaniensis]|uniref:Uncharacterized protein n=1 Tax=Pseudonocardia hispaniensis TaxID=904933 RepID=A0ABW1IWZ3_9PSEU
MVDGAGLREDPLGCRYRPRHVEIEYSCLGAGEPRRVQVRLSGPETREDGTDSDRATGQTWWRAADTPRPEGMPAWLARLVADHHPDKETP